MRWGNSRFLWSRAAAGLLIALFATVGAVRIFLADDERSQDSAAQQFIAAAGRIEPEYVDEPTVVAPAPEPIAISLTIDRSAPVLSYLEEAGLEREEAQRWAWAFERAAA